MTTLLTTALSKMILSASGWRGIFADSGNENDDTSKIDENHFIISCLIAKSFADYCKETIKKNPIHILIGTDSRPTGPTIAEPIIKVLISEGLDVEYLGITAAPEIMAYSHNADAFLYISASHNPIGHNGIKFGKNDGGVISGTEAAKLVEIFKKYCYKDNVEQLVYDLINSCSESTFNRVLKQIPEAKQRALDVYYSFTRKVISGEDKIELQNNLFSQINESVKNNSIAIVCDMNGSARSLSIDSTFFTENGIQFYPINNEAGKINHAIIPEPENLIFCAEEMELLQQGKSSKYNGIHKNAILGYMPDCDGDRGNIVYFNNHTKKAEVLKAQEVFAISVMAELAYLTFCGRAGNGQKVAIAVNDPTSMRIEEIAAFFGAKVSRAEVGEANVVNRARELRLNGYEVRILGEGSNGGNITHPSAVRDPLNSIFALIKLLVLKDIKMEDGKIKKGLFHLWCSLSNQENLYKENFSLEDVIKTLPIYTTTGVTEKRALLQITTKDHALLKAEYQRVFEKDWCNKKQILKNKYGIEKWIAVCNNGTKETFDIKDFSISSRGGLKVIFYNELAIPIAFLWMRGSGTEPVFRIMCDVKGDNKEMEQYLLQWHTELINYADNKISNI